MAHLHLTYRDPGLPLLQALQAEAIAAGLSVHDEPPPTVERRLREMETDLAVVSPGAYGERETDLAILPGACVAAVGATGDLLLHFHPGLRDFTRIAYSGPEGLDLILLRIVLAEKYGLQPEFLRVDGDLAAMLSKADAALAREESTPEIGSDATAEGVIDVVDEWFDLTQLPFVRLLAVGWEQRMDKTLYELVERAGEAADREAIGELDRIMHGRSTLIGTEPIPGHYRFRFSEEVVEGLQAFFRYAFFYGLHRDIPHFNFWKPEEPAT